MLTVTLQFLYSVGHSSKNHTIFRLLTLLTLTLYSVAKSYLVWPTLAIYIVWPPTFSVAHTSPPKLHHIVWSSTFSVAHTSPPKSPFIVWLNPF